MHGSRALAAQPGCQRLAPLALETPKVPSLPALPFAPEDLAETRVLVPALCANFSASRVCPAAHPAEARS